MGIKKLYPNNAEKQKAYREKLRQKQMHQLTEQQKPLSEDYKEKTLRFFLITQGHADVTYSDILHAYEVYKLRYEQEFKEPYNFSTTSNWLHDEKEELLKGISVGDITLFIGSIDEGNTECGVCGYARSGLEDTCPECLLRLNDKSKWNSWRKKIGVS